MKSASGQVFVRQEQDAYWALPRIYESPYTVSLFQKITVWSELSPIDLKAVIAREERAH